MPNISIALQDGFRNDSVTLTIDGHEVYRKADVSTNLAIGLAESVDVSASGDVVRLDVEIPSRTTQASSTVDVGQTPYVGISVSEDGTPQIVCSKQAFRYA
jgi:hypothetical protein